MSAYKNTLYSSSIGIWSSGADGNEIRLYSKAFRVVLLFLKLSPVKCGRDVYSIVQIVTNSGP